MKVRLERVRAAFCTVALLAIAGCGGGGGGDSTPAPAPTPPAPTTTNVSTTVIDGAIQNAVVCIDKNGNGKCDSDETQGKTDASGAVTLAVPNADVGKYPLVASVGTDAVDAVNGPVSVPYTMSAPADQTGVVSPLTTLVQQTVATTGSTTAEAAKSVQDATGLTVSLFQDFTKVAAPTDGSVSAATVARLLVVTTQRQAAAIASQVGTAAIDGATITQVDLDKAIQKKLLELLPALVAALSDPAVLAATTPAAKEAALLAAANTLVTNSGIAPAGVATVVAINTQAAASAPVSTAAPVATLGLRDLNFTNATNWFARAYTGSVAQNTPDVSNNVKYVERRLRSNTGNVAKWGAGSDPARNADLHWNGTAWVNCPLNFENTSSVRDAQGNSVYNYCDKLETGKSNRATFDIGGKTMAEVYAQARTAGYTNVTIANSAAALGTATFPTGSALAYQASTSLSTAYAYYPAGADSPAGTSNIASQYSAAVAAGGNAATQAAGVGCNSSETNTNGTNITTLEGLIAAKPGTPCVYAQGSIVSGSSTFLSDASNEWWGNSTVFLGKLGSVAIGATPTAYYTGNTLLRLAFKGTGTNPVTYYACKERFINGSSRNCTSIGTGSYTITTLGDARVMTLSNPPAQTAALGYNRVFVERGGFVYLGYQSKLGVFNSARLNLAGSNALFAQLGLTPEDPAVPLALTVGSYAGTWDISTPVTPPNPGNGITLFINADGTSSCRNPTNNQDFACSLTLNPATGAFGYADSGGTASGTLNFLTGRGTGATGDVAPTSLVLGRR